MSLVVDLSNNNGSVDVSVLAKSKTVAGIQHKVSEGTHFSDQLFAPRRADAARAGIRFGGYHFARPDINPGTGGAKDEAALFCRLLRKVGRTDLRPALDYETRYSGDNLAWISAFNITVKNRLGVWPLFYSYLSLITEMKLARPVGDGLWLSAFGSNDGADHGFQTPAPWHATAGHQFTSHGRVPGVRGDVDLTHVPKLSTFLAHPVVGRV